MTSAPSPTRLLPILLAICTALFALAAGALAVPTVTVLSPAANATVNALTTISVTFSEAVTGVDANDLLINNNAGLTVAGSGAGPYTFTFSQPSPARSMWRGI